MGSWINPHVFTVWPAGGGVKGGAAAGRYEKLTYFYNGRNMRLTGVSGSVIREIPA